MLVVIAVFIVGGYSTALLSGVGADSTGPSPVILQGAGATFPADVYVAWMAAYRSVRLPFVDVRMKYAARGSGYGKASIANQRLYGDAYAGSDSVLAKTDYNATPDLQMFPSIAGSVPSRLSCIIL